MQGCTPAFFRPNVPLLFSFNDAVRPVAMAVSMILRSIHPKIILHRTLSARVRREDEAFDSRRDDGPVVPIIASIEMDYRVNRPAMNCDGGRGAGVGDSRPGRPGGRGGGAKFLSRGRP